jgi:hypothetical protein
MPSPSDLERDDEHDEIIVTVARLLLDSIEKDLREHERADAHGALLFEGGFRCGVLTAIDGLAHRLPLQDLAFDPRDATEEQVGDWLEREVFAALAAWQDNVVEWTMRRILREQEDEEG